GLQGRSTWGSEGNRMGAKNKSRVGKFGSGESDPKAGANVTNVGNNRVIISASDEPPQPRIEQAEERFRAGAAIQDMRPGVAVEKRHVPLNVGAKFRVVARLGASKGAIGHVEILRRLHDHAAEKRRLVLH